MRSNVSMGALGKLQARVGAALQAGLAASFCSPRKQIRGRTSSLEDIDTSMLLLTRKLHHLWMFLKGCPKWAGEACLKSPHRYPCSHKAARVQGRQWTVTMPAHHRPLMQVHVHIEISQGGPLAAMTYPWTSAAGWKCCRSGAS